MSMKRIYIDTLSRILFVFIAIVLNLGVFVFTSIIVSEWLKSPQNIDTETKILIVIIELFFVSILLTCLPSYR